MPPYLPIRAAADAELRRAHESRLQPGGRRHGSGDDDLRGRPGIRWMPAAPSSVGVISAPRPSRRCGTCRRRWRPAGRTGARGQGAALAHPDFLVEIDAVAVVPLEPPA
jgi:hypothetical protein